MIGKKVGLLLFTAFAWSACIQLVEVDLPPETPKLVLVSHFTEGEPIRVRITLSQPLNAGVNVNEILRHGDVTLAADGIFFNRLALDSTAGGYLFWRSRDLLKAGVRYSVTARFPGFDTAQGSDTIPSPVVTVGLRIKGDSIRVLKDSAGLWIMRVPVQIHVTNLPKEHRYFAFGLQYELRKGPSSGSGAVELRPASFLANGRTLALTYGTPENLFLINENYWNDGNTSVEVEALLPYMPAEEHPTQLHLEWRTLSTAYYRYHLSLATQGSPLSDPDALFNNVEGGYGNISGFARQRKSVSLPQ